ncbi:MAG TPA: glycosyltransferase family 39 protein [Anaerolineae bacterium]|nr:glycosyltransferase family 39 protein [Anaerolineae bacterium]
MLKRWYLSLIFIGLTLNTILFGWMYRRRLRSRATQPTPDRSPAATAAFAPQPARPTAYPIAPSPASPILSTAAPSATIASSRQLSESTTTRRVAVGILLIAAILLAVRAQSLFSVDWLLDRDAGIPYAIAAMIAFAVVAYLADRWLGKAHDITDCPTAPHKINVPAKTNVVAEIRSGVKQHPWRTVGVIISIILWFVTLSNLRIDPPLPDYSLTLIMWLASIVLFAVSIVIPRPHQRRDWRAWWHLWWAQNWLFVVAVSAIGALALALRVINLDTIPPTLGGDEGSQGVEALKILHGQLINPFVTSWMSVPTMSFFFNTLTVGPLGNTTFALRLPWALIGTATVLIVFALTRRLKGLALGLMTGALLAAYHYHIHFSRLGSNQVADAFFMAAAFFFLYRAYDEGGMINWVMAGIVAGLAQYFYAGARFVTIMVGVTMLYFIVRERWAFVRTHWRGMIVAGAAFIISAGPMLQYAVVHPDEYNGRLNMVGIFQNGWLNLAENLWHQSPAQLLIDYQLKRAALAYNAYPDPTYWYGSPRPLFDGLWAILFLLGMGYGLSRPLDRRLFPMLIWWWGAIILGGMLTENPPSSQRLITSAPPAVFFVALAIWKIGQISERVLRVRGAPTPEGAAPPRSKARRLLLPALGAALIAVLCWVSVEYYFVDYTPSRVYGNYTAVTADALARYAKAQLDPARDRMVFFGAPQMYIDFGSIKYLVPDVAGQDVADPLTAPFDPKILPDDKRPVFIFMPFRLNELAFVQQTYPHGTVEQLVSPIPGATEPLLTVYRAAN